MNLIGRLDAQSELSRVCESPRPEFVVVSGRRRVGKTYLVREYFGGSFAFYTSGVAGGNMRAQLKSFSRSLGKHGSTGPEARDWWEAFDRLEALLSLEAVTRDEASGKRVVFIDEMPWLDSPRSEFLSALELFWNTWGSAQPDLLLIACGSASSWIIKKLFKNRGGLHNRVTARIHLEPFTLRECEEYYRVSGPALSRQEVLEGYLVFGGIPYYMDLMHRRLGLVQNVDRLCFAPGAPLADEFDELYHSLFKKAERHVAVVRALATKGVGLTRDEVSRASGVANGGTLTNTLEELAACGFVRSYHAFGKRSSGRLFQLIDPFTLFYLRFVEGATDERFWAVNCQSPRVNAWRGYAFELLCLLHVRQIRQSLGIEVISADVSSWRASGDVGAQVDLVIDRADGLINLCEIKWSRTEYAITKAYDAALRAKVQAFLDETHTRKAPQLTVITPYGLKSNAYSGNVQAQVTADALFG